MTTDPPFDPTAPLAGPPEPWESAPTPSAAIRPAVSHDRHDRGRAGAGRQDPRSPCGSRAAAAATLAGGRPGDGRGGRPGHRDRLRDVRARGARGRGDPARGGARRRPGERLDPGGAGLRALARRRRPAVSSSASPTRAGRPPRTRRSRRPRSAGANDRRHHRQPPLTGGRAGRDRGRDRRARPRLVPHGRLPQPDPGRRRGRRAPVRSPTRRGDRRRGCWPMAPATRPGADGDRGGPRRCGAAPGRRVRDRTAPPAASSCSRSRRRRGCRRPTATSRRSSTATCPRPDRRRGSSWSSPIATSAPSGWRAPGRPSPRHA